MCLGCWWQHDTDWLLFITANSPQKDADEIKCINQQTLNVLSLIALICTAFQIKMMLIFFFKLSK